MRTKASGWPEYRISAEEAAVVAGEHCRLLRGHFGGGHRRASGEGTQGLFAYRDHDACGRGGQRVDVRLIADFATARAGGYTESVGLPAGKGDR